MGIPDSAHKKFFGCQHVLKFFIYWLFFYFFPLYYLFYFFFFFFFFVLRIYTIATPLTLSRLPLSFFFLLCNNSYFLSLPFNCFILINFLQISSDPFQFKHYTLDNCFVEYCILSGIRYPGQQFDTCIFWKQPIAPSTKHTQIQHDNYHGNAAWHPCSIWGPVHSNDILWRWEIIIWFPAFQIAIPKCTEKRVGHNKEAVSECSSRQREAPGSHEEPVVDVRPEFEIHAVVFAPWRPPHGILPFQLDSHVVRRVQGGVPGRELAGGHPGWLQAYSAEIPPPYRLRKGKCCLVHVCFPTCALHNSSPSVLQAGHRRSLDHRLHGARLVAILLLRNACFGMGLFLLFCI